MALFMLAGLWAGRKGVVDSDEFLSGRSTQSWPALAANFVAAGIHLLF
jgi:hypothetical protein